VYYKSNLIPGYSNMSVRVKYADVKGLMSLPGVSERQAWNIVQKQQKHGYLDMNMLSEDEADDEERIAGFTLSHPFRIS
jgi:hypothetical protein